MLRLKVLKNSNVFKIALSLKEAASVVVAEVAEATDVVAVEATVGAVEVVPKELKAHLVAANVAVVAVVTDPELLSHQLSMAMKHLLMLKINPVHSEVPTVLDSRASLVKVHTHTIVKMVLVVEDAVTRKTVTERVTGAKKLLVLSPLKKAKKVKLSLKPLASQENPVNLASLVNLVNPRLKNPNLNLLLRKKLVSPWICTWLRNKPRARVFTRNQKFAQLKSLIPKISRLLKAPRLSSKEVVLQLSKLMKFTL